MADKTVNLYWTGTVFDDGTGNPKTVFGYQVEPTKEGFFVARMPASAAEVELKRKGKRFISEKDYKALMPKKTGNGKKGSKGKDDK